MKITLTDIEREAHKNSPIHRLDGRVKILLTLFIILYAVSLPRIDDANFTKLAILEAYLIVLILIAGLNPVFALVRYLVILPFGGGIAAIQPFFKQTFVDTHTQLYQLPLGIVIWQEGALFGLTLFLKFTVCLTAIILMSSTTTMQDLINSARRLGMPAEFAILFNLMGRYLFLFVQMFNRIRTAQKTRCFNIWNRNVPRRWILEQIGYTVASIFVRAYEQGERTYVSMLARGYSSESPVYVSRKKFAIMDVIIVLTTVGVVAWAGLFV